MMMTMFMVGGILFNQVWGMLIILMISMVIMMSDFLNWGNMEILMGGMGVDIMSKISLMLTLSIMMSIFMVDNVWKDFMYKSLLMGISMSLILCFMSVNIFSFYIFFEVILLPMFLLVVLYGNYEERLESGLYMMFYTIVGSIPLLLMMIKGLGDLSWSFMYMEISKKNFIMNSVGSLMIMGAFLSKLPMYGVHIWLPKAHVEAPVVGSMILAGVLLKLGGYGMLRMLTYMNMMFYEETLLMMSGLMGGIYCGLACLRQSDMKKLVAYSSVVHMGFMLSGMFSYMSEGYIGSIMMMVVHGLCSSGLFFFVNILYTRVFTRSSILSKGCLGLNSFGMLWCFLLVSVNSGIPPFLSMFSESLLLMSLLKLNMLFIILISILFFVSVAYGIYLYSLVCHGKEYNGIMFKSFLVQEYFLLCLHFVPICLLVFGSDMFTI